MPRGGKRPGAGRKKGSTKPPISRLPSSQAETPSIVRVLEMMLERRGKFARQDMDLIRQAAVNGWLHFTDEDAAMMVDMVRRAGQSATTIKEMVAVAKTYAALRGVNMKALEAVAEMIADRAEDPGTIEQHAHLHLHADADSQRTRLDALAARLGLRDIVESNTEPPGKANCATTQDAGGNGSTHSNGANGKAGGFPFGHS